MTSARVRTVLAVLFVLVSVLGGASAAHATAPGANWTAIPPGPAPNQRSNPVTVSFGASQHLFVAGADRAIYHNAVSANGVWSGWTKVPGAVTNEDISAVVFNNEINVFYQSWDTLQPFRVVMAANGTWGRPEVVFVSRIFAGLNVVVINGTLSMFVRTAMGDVCRLVFDGVWHSCEPLPTNSHTSDTPSAVLAGNQLNVFVRSADTRILRSTLVGTTWSDWQAVPGTFVTGEVSAVLFNAAINLVVRTTDNRISRNVLTGTTWGQWIPVPNLITAASPSASVFNGSLIMTAVNDDQTLWRTRNTR